VLRDEVLVGHGLEQRERPGAGRGETGGEAGLEIGGVEQGRPQRF
jgi:hypothetical protein